MNTRLAPLDVNFWSLDSSNTQQLIATYCIVDHAPDLNGLRQAIEEQLLHFPRLKRKISARPFWTWEEDERFSITRHAFEIVDENVRSRKQLDELAEKHFSSPMSHEFPLWDFVIFRGANTLDFAAVMFRVHHAVADGLGGFEFFHRVCHVAPEEREKNSGRSGGHLSAKTVKAPPRFGVHPWRSLRRLLQECSARPQTSNVNGRNSSRRELRYIDIPIPELRAVRKRVGAAVNDVLLSLVAGTLASYQAATGGEPRRMRALIPFSLRLRQNATALGNHLTGVAVELPTTLSDPLQRVASVRSILNQMKLDGSFGAFKMLGSLTGLLPEMLRRPIVKKAAHRTNLICTNMPGPEKPLYIVDAKILANYGCAALLDHQGIAFSFVSYAGMMHVSFISDPAIIPDPDVVLRLFHETWKEFLRALPEPSIRSASRTAMR